MFNMLSMIAQFERDLISARTREGMEIARQRGRLKGKRPKLNKRQDALVAEWIANHTMSQAEIGETLGVSPATISRTKRRLIDSGQLDPETLHRDWKPRTDDTPPTDK